LYTWKDDCVAQTGSQNSYVGTDGVEHFYEVSRREHNDGAITGTTYACKGDQCRKRGAFRIDWDGQVSRYPSKWPFKKGK
jgi:hypothetical protein